jgi:hypothetical protein
MERPGSRRAVLLVVGLLALTAGVAGLARWRLDRGHPPAPADWWRPRAAVPVIDPALLARAARERRALDEELASRRERLRPVPERLAEATAVAQLGHVGPITALAWYGADLLTAGRDATLRYWRFDGRRLRPASSGSLPGEATALAASPSRGRVWAYVEPGLLVAREGERLELERVRPLPAGRALGLAAADDGQHVVLLLERPAAGGGVALAVRHYLEPETVLLKEVALDAVRPLSAALAPDGERVAVLVGSATGPVVELRRAADGAVLRTVSPGVPWWTVEAPGPLDRPTVGLGSDFLAVADAGGVVFVPLGADAAPGAPVSFPRDGLSGGVAAVGAACDGAVVASGPAEAVVLRRTADGWRAERAGSVVDRAACTAGGTVVALVRGAGLEVRSPAGSAEVGPGGALSGATLVGGGAGVALWRADGSAALARTSFELGGFTATSGAAAGELLAVDAGSGEALRSAAGQLWLDTAGGSAEWRGVEGAHPVALRAGVVASFDPGGRRLVLQDRAGAERGSWPVPEWLGLPHVSLCADGRTVVAAGAGGFSAWRAGSEEPLLYFPGEGYEAAPAEVTPDGRYVVVGRGDGTIEQWSPASWEVERSWFAINAQGGRPTVIRWSADGEALYVGGSRGGVVALQGRTGNPLWGDVLHEGPVTVLEPAAAGPWVLSADGRTAALTAARGGERLLRLVAGRAGSWAAFTDDGYHVTGGPAGAELLALRPRAAGAEPGKPGWTLVGAEDSDFAGLGGAVDALRVTLLGVAAAGEEE